MLFKRQKICVFCCFFFNKQKYIVAMKEKYLVWIIYMKKRGLSGHSRRLFVLTKLFKYE